MILRIDEVAPTTTPKFLNYNIDLWFPVALFIVHPKLFPGSIMRNLQIIRVAVCVVWHILPDSFIPAAVRLGDREHSGRTLGLVCTARRTLWDVCVCERDWVECYMRVKVGTTNVKLTILLFVFQIRKLCLALREPWLPNVSYSTCCYSKIFKVLV